jgi:hypothetical protein
MCSEHVHAHQHQRQHHHGSYGQRQQEPGNRRLMVGHSLRLESGGNIRGRELGRVDTPGGSVGAYEVGPFRPARWRRRWLRSAGPRLAPSISRHQRFGRKVLDYDRSRRRTRCFGWIRCPGRAGWLRQGSSERRPIQHTGIVPSCPWTASRGSGSSIHRGTLWHRARGGPTCTARCGARRGSDAICGVGFGGGRRGASGSSSRGRYRRRHRSRSIRRPRARLHLARRRPRRRRRCRTGRRGHPRRNHRRSSIRRTSWLRRRRNRTIPAACVNRAG